MPTGETDSLPSSLERQWAAGLEEILVFLSSCQAACSQNTTMYNPLLLPFPSHCARNRVRRLIRLCWSRFAVLTQFSSAPAKTEELDFVRFPPPLLAARIVHASAHQGEGHHPRPPVFPGFTL